MDSVNEEYFNQAVNYMGKAVTDMDQANSTVSGISIPADFSGAATVEAAITGINSEIKPQVDTYATTFQGLSQNVASYIAMEKNAQAGAANLNTPLALNGFDGKTAALLTSGGIIDLSSFIRKDTVNGTFFSWAGGKNTGMWNSSDIYIPNVSKPEGVMITFAATGTIRAFKNGEIQTSSIVIFPGYSNDLYLTDNEAKNITQDAKNIAATFGVDPRNISICGFSQGGSLVGSLVSKNDPGTFKTAIFASTRYGYDGVTDPNVKVITLIGSNEADRSNGIDTRIAFEKFKATHGNTSEVYIVTEEPGMDAHMNVVPQALKLKEFNGENIFDYASTPGTQTTPLPEPGPSPEITPTPETTPGPLPTPSVPSRPTPSVPSTPAPSVPSRPTPSVPSTPAPSVPSTPAPSVPSTPAPSRPTPSVPSTPAPSRPTPSVPSTPAPTPAPSTPVVTSNVLPENKFSDALPELKSGNLGTMDISTEQVKYSISDITDSDYKTYLTSLSEKGYTLSSDGTYWINGNNKIYINYLDSNLTINLTNSTYL